MCILLRMDEINMNVGDNSEALVIIDDSDSEAIPIRAQYGGNFFE